MVRLSYPKSKDDKLADLLLARINTRETSTLTIVTVTSSASLVLLGLAGVSGSGIVLVHPWLRLGAFAFAMFGILYREITILTIDFRDLKELYELEPRLKQEYQPGRRSRSFLLRLLFLSPLGATVQLASNSVRTLYAELWNLSPPYWWPYILIPCFWLVFLPSLYHLRKFPQRWKLVTLGVIGILLAVGMFAITSPPPWLPWLAQIPYAITFPLAAASYVLVSSILLTLIEPRP